MTAPGWRLAPDIAVVEGDGVDYAAVLPDGPILVLTGVTQSVWRAARTVPASELVATIADAYGQDEQTVQRPVLACLAQLVDAHALIPSGAAAASNGPH